MSTKERPILFSGPMVRAILQGRKTQTRRIVKGDPATVISNIRTRDEKVIIPEWWFSYCPYGQPGDRLWVRETFYQFGHWESVPGVKTKTGRMKWRFVAHNDFVLYDAPDEFRKGRHHKDPATPAWHKRLGRFMPRWASRITLEITGVRAERLNDISNEDCVAEGITAIGKGVRMPDGRYAQAGRYETKASTVRQLYSELWESINGPGSWGVNPWVWVVEFKRVGGQP
jgi:hypothetical protein